MGWTIVYTPDMDSRTEIIKAIEAYAAQSGLKPSTICQYAVRNRRLYYRLLARQEQDEALAQRLLHWMRDNPPAQGRAPGEDSAA